MVKFGIALVPYNTSMSDIIKKVQTAESAGFDMVAFADANPFPGYEDIYVTMMSALHASKKIVIASGVNVPYTRHPALLACAFNSMNRIFPGRVILGLGAGGSLPMKPLGIPMYNKPIAAISESFKIIRDLFDGKTVEYQGKVFELHNTNLVPPPKDPIPIYLAARGPQMTKLIGKYSDGSFMTAPTSYLDHAIDLIKKGATNMGRDLKEIAIGNWLPTALEKDPKKADKLASKDLTYMVSDTPDYVHNIAGIPLDDVNRLRQALPLGLEKAMDFVTDQMLDELAIRGDAETCISLLDSWVKKGTDLIIFGEPFADDPIAGINGLAEKVVTHFK